MRETQQIKKMFDRIVKRYDFLNRLLSFGQDTLWRKKAAKKAVDSQTKIVLDLAVGTGDLAKELLKNRVRVIGLDISLEMLRIAKRKIKGSFNPVAGSGYQLPFRDESFDTVTCAFGIRNMHQTETALKEIHRVIKNGQKIVILEFSLPRNFFRTPYLFYLRKIVPFFASLFSARSAYEYLSHSIEEFYEPLDFVYLLKNSGFKDINVYSLSFGTVYLYVGKKSKSLL